MQSAFLYALADEIPWRKSQHAEGVFVKDLGTSDGQSIQLVKFEAGANFPLHKHNGPEFIYMLEGEVVQEGNVIKQGSVAIAAKNSTETEFYSNAGCTFLLVYTD